MTAQAQVQSTKQRDTIASARRHSFRLHAKLARSHASLFNGFVLRDEHTHKPITQTELHSKWHQLADEHDHLVIWSHVESGKTNQMSIGRVLYALGKDPSLRVAIVSNTAGQAKKILNSIKKYIEESEELREVFPNLVPGDLWTSEQITVKRPSFSKDPSVQVCGVHGSIVGARIDLLILDDLLDYENSRTEHLREDLDKWYKSTLEGRLTKNARVICIGTAWHPEDFLHRCAKSGWFAVRYPVLDEHGESRWPSIWTKERIEEKRTRLGPVEWARQMLCIARDDSEARFKRDWIDVALKKGDGRCLAYQLNIIPNNVRVYTGVDLAVKKKSSSDFTVMLTIMVHPTGEREVIGLERGKWSGPEIVNRIHEVHRRYNSIIIVEDNAAQEYLVQFAPIFGSAPIRPFTTGKNKFCPEFGVESIATEMATGRWIIPNRGGKVDPSLESLINEMLYYDPVAHTGDCLMAMWFAREGVRLGEIKPTTGYVDLMSR